MNPLETLMLESVSIDSRNPTLFTDWSYKALYFNGNGSDGGSAGDPRFDREHAAWADWCERLGIYFCLWFGVPRLASGGTRFAELCSNKVTTYGGSARVHAVMFDNEKVPLGFQQEYITRWDQLRPYRPTLYSVEPIQDESVNHYDLMLAQNQKTLDPAGASPFRSRKITFQCYQGGMQPLDPLTVRTAQYGTARIPDDDLNPTIDPAQPARYIASAAACGLKGLMLFSAERMP